MDLRTRDQILDQLSRAEVVPWDQCQYVVEALRGGASRRDAAKAAGLSPLVVEVMFELGESGVEPWAEFYAVALQADYLSQEATIERRKDLSENGGQNDIKLFSQYKDAEQFGTLYGEERAKAIGGSGGQHSLPGGVTVQIAQFSPPQSKPELSAETEKVIEVLPNPLKKELT